MIKPVTSVAAMMLVEEGEVDLAAPVHRLAAHLTVITTPLRSALTIAPTELPVNVSTAPC